MYNIRLEKRAAKDAIKIERYGLKEKVLQLLQIIKINPFQNPPPYEKMLGYENRYSRRINSKHRLLYEIAEDRIKILKM